MSTPPPQIQDAPKVRGVPEVGGAAGGEGVPEVGGVLKGGNVLEVVGISGAQSVPGSDGAGRVEGVSGVWDAASPGQRQSGARRLLGPVLLLGVWQLAVSTGPLDERTLAGPLAVAGAARDLVADGTLQKNLWISLGRAGAGLASGVGAGVVLAVLSGLFRLGEDVIDGPMRFLRAMPIVAVIPLATAWFGVGEPMTILLVASGAAFPIYIATHAAIRGVDPRHVELARTVGLDRRALVRRVILPGALPGFFTGLRLAVAIAWLVLAVAEQIDAGSGIGFLTNQDKTDVIVVGLLVYALLGLVSDKLVRLVERRVLRWRPTSEGS